MKKSVVIIGGGPSAILLASFLDPNMFSISIYEQNKALGRKFLVAGDGGFNITHSEELKTLISRYTPSSFFTDSLNTFSNLDLRNWLDEIGIPTFIGSSKRVYPEKGIKPIEVLQAIEKVLQNNKIDIHFKEEWKGWEKDELLFTSGKIDKADHVIFALGGGSWKVTGSNDRWLTHFEQKGIDTLPFLPSNCAYEVKWNKKFIQKHEGKPLKNLAISCGKATQKGEAVITSFGLEGNAIYALSPELRKQLSTNEAVISLDLKPMLTKQQIIEKMKQSSFKKITDILKNDLKLSSVQIDLIKAYSTKKTFLDQEALYSLIKNLELKVTSMAPLDEAISTVGGIELHEIDSHYQLKKLPNHFCLGEMLDWDAPTGGYLLQACLSMGVRLASYLNKLEQ